MERPPAFAPVLAWICRSFGIYSLTPARQRKFSIPTLNLPQSSTRRYKDWLHLKSVSGGYQSPRIVVKIDSGNKFVVEQGAAGLEIYLNEKMGITLAKEMTVVDASGKELYKGKPDYSIAAMVDSIESKRDPEVVFTAKIKL